MLILDLQDGHAIAGAGLLGARDIDSRTGNNAGNFAFRYALTQRFFPHAVLATFAGINDLVAPDMVVVMACSNWIGLSEGHEQANRLRLESLASAQVRTVPFGLGCQAPAGTRYDQLGPWTRGFLQRLGETSASISVRDEQTAEILAQMGYDRACVTGCPSNFINPDPALGARLADKVAALQQAGAQWPALAIGLTEYSGGYPYSGAVFKRQLDLMRRHAATYVIQDLPLLSFLLRETDTLPGEYSMQHFHDVVDDEQQLKTLLRRQVACFSSFDEWMLSMRRLDICFGMRLHGNMAAFQAGTPALVLTHDERTAQLCQTMSIPHLPAQAWLADTDTSPAPLWAAMSAALARYDERRRTLAGIMAGHLRASRLAVPAALASLLPTGAEVHA